jgi:hypothetical protein
MVSAGRKTQGPLHEVEHALAGLLKGRTGQIGARSVPRRDPLDHSRCAKPWTSL